MLILSWSGHPVRSRRRWPGGDRSLPESRQTRTAAFT